MDRVALLESLEARVLFSRALGVDVSSYQGTINWHSAYSAGERFAWAKATEGVGYADPTFKANETNATAAGVVAGAYHFARYDLGNGASAEAAWFLKTAGPYVKAGYLRPVLDVEENTSMSKTSLSAWVNAWCTTVYQHTGVRPIVYTYPSFAQAHLNSTVTQWTLWMANYNNQNPQSGGPSSTSPWTGWGFWQYSSTGHVSGIAGAVDLDVAHGDMTSYVIPQFVAHSSQFAVGQVVHVTATSGLKAWNTYTSNGTYVVEPLHKTGVIKGGPVFINGYERWAVQYAGDPTVRWSAADWLAAGA